MKIFPPLTACLAFLLTTLAAGPLKAEAVERREEGSLVIEGIPTFSEELEERMQAYLNTRSAAFRGWNPAGPGIYITTRFGETAQIHYLDHPGGARKQLTFKSEPVSRINLRPATDQQGFLYTRDNGGDEYYQLYFFDLENSRDILLSDGKSRNTLGVWDRDGSRVAFSSTRANNRDYGIYLADLDNPQDARQIHKGVGFWGVGQWAHHSDQLIIYRYVSANESEIHILDIASGETTQVNPAAEKISYGAAVWGHDDSYLLISNDQNEEFTKLKRYDLATAETVTITREIDWDVETLAIDEAGLRAAFSVNAGGISEVYLLDPVSLEYQRLEGTPLGLSGSLDWDPTGTRLGLTINTPKSPSDVYSYDLQTQQWTRWTHSEVGGLDTEKFIEPELIHYPTFDTVDGETRMIPAFYYKPAGKGPFPVVIDIHGGPEGQSRPRFSSTVQFLLKELETAVIYPNVRGSDGYGKSYLLLDNGFQREDSVRDISALIDWVRDQPELDNNRVAVDGGSYGGYMVYASLIHNNDRLAGGLSVVGISHFVTFLENTKAYRRDLRRVEYGDERDPEMRAFLDRISPLTQAHKITKPIFIAQGLNDPRVPASEAEQILAAIRENGGNPWYMLARDEGHGFRKKSNRDFFNLAAMSFWIDLFEINN